MPVDMNDEDIAELYVQLHAEVIEHPTNTAYGALIATLAEFAAKRAEADGHDLSLIIKDFASDLLGAADQHRRDRDRLRELGRNPD